jgi:hypothetical protein
VKHQSNEVVIPNGSFNFLCEFVEVHVAGIAIVARAHDSNLCFFKIVFG